MDTLLDLDMILKLYQYEADGGSPSGRAPQTICHLKQETH